jgi:F420-dependent oxidoreductase-like protein
MKIGLSGRTMGRQRIAEHAQQAEADGFAALWFPGGAGGDALGAIVHSGVATDRIRLGTAVLATYPQHPVLLAARAAAVVDALGPDRLVLGIGPSHRPLVEDMYGLSYTHPAQHTAEFLSVLQAQLSGEPVALDGEVLRVHVPKVPAASAPVPVVLGALGPRMLELAGGNADGTVLWMANATAIREHVAPRVRAAAERAGRPAPTIVAGLPVVVHDDVAEAREIAARQFAVYGSLPNYQRILARGGVAGPADAVVAGDEQSVTDQLAALIEAGATEIWADVFAVGGDKAASRERTAALLRTLVG